MIQPFLVFCFITKHAKGGEVATDFLNFISRPVLTPVSPVLLALLDPVLVGRHPNHDALIHDFSGHMSDLADRRRDRIVKHQQVRQNHETRLRSLGVAI